MRLRGKHKPTFTPHMDDRRQRHRHQRRKGGADRPQARAEGLLPLHRLYRRHQGTLGQVDPRGPLPRAHRRKGRRAHAARAARSAASSSAICASTRAPSIRTPPRQPATLDVAEPEPQERAERLIMAETLSLARGSEGLGTPAPQPEAPASCAEARQARPRLRDRQAQERHRPRLDQARQGQDHRQRHADSTSISRAPCCA